MTSEEVHALSKTLCRLLGIIFLMINWCALPYLTLETDETSTRLPQAVVRMRFYREIGYAQIFSAEVSTHLFASTWTSGVGKQDEAMGFSSLELKQIHLGNSFRVIRLACCADAMQFSAARRT
jgi:hypothetical protein